MQTFDYVYRRAYTNSIQQKVSIQEADGGNEQRRRLWTAPLRTWVLEFAKDPRLTEKIATFIEARSVNYEKFYWQWWKLHPITGERLGGNDRIYVVRFDFQDSKIDFNHQGYGYNTFTIPLKELR